VVENSAGHEGISDEGDYVHSPVAERTLQNIDSEDAAK
jgi:hypothetical protein